MLKGLSPLLSPDLLSVLSRMGHGDEIVLADAHFPGETYGKRMIRADGLGVAALIDAIVRLSHLAADCPQIKEMDINPLIVRHDGQGVLAVDARIILS